MSASGERVFVSTYKGHRFFPLDPCIDDVDIEDIAHGLAYQCRFNGQTTSFYSVAQHSLLVASIVPEKLRLSALLHDAAEAYLGDIVKPLKILVPQFSVIEKQVSAIISKCFSVYDLDHPSIKEADLVLLATEKRDLMPNSVEAWSSIAGLTPIAERIVPQAPERAKSDFLAAWTAWREC
jgi:5'-deoxynucleotidase YfbR-like HD superfamily hydrolase